MVEEQLERRGIASKEVLDAMRKVPREEFVEEDYREAAYSDRPLPIGEGQTISQPYVVAMMVEALNLRRDDKVLDIGTGSGYAAAVLSLLVDEVYSMERIEALAEKARRRCERLGYDNIHIRHADGTMGWVEEAPFDGIVAAAAGPTVPQSICDQLAPGGRLVIPVGERLGMQRMIRITRAEEGEVWGDEEGLGEYYGEFKEERLADVRFVPLIGRQGFEDPSFGDGSSNNDGFGAPR
jgi:protein-L-isoaspartate(D-aspartate) O-methyltransferase